MYSMSRTYLSLPAQPQAVTVVGTYSNVYDSSIHVSINSVMSKELQWWIKTSKIIVFWSLIPYYK